MFLFLFLAMPFGWLEGMDVVVCCFDDFTGSFFVFVQPYSHLAYLDYGGAGLHVFLCIVPHAPQSVSMVMEQDKVDESDERLASVFLKKAKNRSSHIWLPQNGCEIVSMANQGGNETNVGNLMVYLLYKR